MAFPSYVLTRTVSVGGAAILESSDPLRIRLTITASKSLINADTGYRFKNSRFVTTSEAGTDAVAVLPRTDMSGWKDARTGDIIDVTAEGSYTHQYIALVEYLTADGDSAGISPDTIGPFIVPAGDGAIDLDKLVPVGSSSGESISFPAYWDDLVQQAQASAAAAQAALLDSADFIGSEIARAGSPAEQALLPKIGAVVDDVLGDVDLEVDTAGLAAQPPAALARIRAAVSRRDSAPVVFVGAGSSTTFGTASTSTSKRYLNLVAGKMQARYPSLPGPEKATVTLTTAVTNLPLGNGIQFVNAGIGGTAADNYLTPTTRAQVMSLNPSVILHMVISNDFKFQTPLATFKARMLAQIAALDALATSPLVHILIQPHERYDATFTPTITYAEYGRVQAEIAADNPATVAFIDLSPAFRAIGIPSSDPYTFMDSDHIHLDDAGHAFLADLVFESLTQQLGRGFPVLGVIIPPPTPGTTFTRVTSDAYSGADAASITGLPTDAALGGTPSTYVSSGANTYVQRAGGKATRGGNAGAAFIGPAPLSTGDMYVEVKYDVLPSATGNGLISRRSSLSSTGVSQYRVLLDGGVAQLGKTVAGTESLLGVTHAVVNGDRVGLYVFGDQIKLYINGAVVETITDSSVAYGGGNSYAGYRVGTSSTFTIDDLIVDAVS